MQYLCFDFDSERDGRLQEIGRSDPHLIQLINNNQQEFMRMLSEPAPAGAAANLEAAMGRGGDWIFPEYQNCTESRCVASMVRRREWCRNSNSYMILICTPDRRIATQYSWGSRPDDLQPHAT